MLFCLQSTGCDMILLTNMDIRTFSLLAVTLLGGGAGERGGLPGEEILFLQKFFCKDFTSDYYFDNQLDFFKLV